MANPWDVVYDRVRILRCIGGVYDQTLQIRPAVLREAGESRWLAWDRRDSKSPISDLVDEAEQQLGTRFPESYRAFMLRFGSGALGNRVDILHPIGTNRWHNVLGYTRHLRTFFRDNIGEDDAHATWLGELVYFGSDEFGSAYAWHPLEVTSSKPHECRLYRLQRANEDTPQIVGETFTDFLCWVAAEEAGSYSQEPTEDAWFEPCPLWVREKPKNSDVHKWLFFNNRTARLIAKSIRNGRTDAFPILADALQDAGCTHADLLDACRTGDPDIDGRWVLQVLLGET